MDVEVLRAYLFEITVAGSWVSRKAGPECRCDSLKTGRTYDDRGKKVQFSWEGPVELHKFQRKHNRRANGNKTDGTIGQDRVDFQTEKCAQAGTFCRHVMDDCLRSSCRHHGRLFQNASLTKSELISGLKSSPRLSGCIWALFTTVIILGWS